MFVKLKTFVSTIVKGGRGALSRLPFRASWLLITLGVIGITLSVPHLKTPRNLQPIVTQPAAIAAAVQPALPPVMARSEPTSIQIDKVNIYAPVVSLGLDANHALQTPSGPRDVGWYNQGPTPGERGPAVMVGHVDWVNTIAVFWRLRELVPGDTINITRADGKTVTFKVDSIEQFDQSNFPTQEVYGPINYAGLRLITCGGTFNRATHHYDHNTVVFATLVTK